MPRRASRPAPARSTIGLEDTTLEPGGQRTAGNAALVRAARALGAGGPVA